MLIATSLCVASVLLLSPALTTRPIAVMPPLVIGVTVAADISPTLIPRVLAEAEAIWRPTGVVIVWEREGGMEMHAPLLRVWIGDGTGRGNRDEAMPLGWIGFEDDGSPTRNIYVSHANALALMNMMAGSSSAARMPRAERETMLGRAMGRALAHELGHYLLARRGHSEKGLMRARRTSAEFFARDATRFAIDEEQRAMVLSRLRPGGVLTASAAAIPSAIPGEPGTHLGWTLDDAHSRKFERD